MNIDLIVCVTKNGQIDSHLKGQTNGYVERSKSTVLLKQKRSKSSSNQPRCNI
jgi:hypothetical protein